MIFTVLIKTAFDCLSVDSILRFFFPYYSKIGGKSDFMKIRKALA